MLDVYRISFLHLQFICNASSSIARSVRVACCCMYHCVECPLFGFGGTCLRHSRRCNSNCRCPIEFSISLGTVRGLKRIYEQHKANMKLP